MTERDSKNTHARAARRLDLDLHLRKSARRISLAGVAFPDLSEHRDIERRDMVGFGTVWYMLGWTMGQLANFLPGEDEADHSTAA